MPRRLELRHLLPAGRPARRRLLIPPPTPDAAWFRARLAAPPPPDQDDGTAWTNDAEFAGEVLTEAAVLVPIIVAPTPGVLLTKRTETLRRHAGQVSFPGGRIDPTDATPEQAALRESTEEIGLDSACVELLGRLGTYVTGTGFRVTPVLGLLAKRPILLNAPAEVAEVFELPLSVLLDPNAPERRSAEYLGRLRHYWVWPHPTHYIWGATAAILVQLARRLRQG
jgi:8-oxo-dGTP pyrophosphatase MutT (NUDIX family)